MNKIISSIILICFIQITQAQTQAVVTYDFFSYGGFQIETTLRIDGSQSWYTHHQEYTEIINDNGFELYHYDDHSDWYLDLNQNQVVEQRQQHSFPLLLSKSKANLKWNILDETKIINGVKVQKATTKALIKASAPLEYGEAIAWFATEIPFSTGPERYYGLPGLIVRLEYSGRTMHCQMKKIEYVKVDEIIPKNDGISVTAEQIVNPYTIDKKWLKGELKKLSK